MIQIIQDFIRSEEKLEESDYNAQFFKIRNDQDDLRCKNEFSCKIGSDSKYYQKNRYRDIIPYDKNRVQLHCTSESPDRILTEEEEEGYINASFVEYPNVNTKYIAAQAPMSSTLDDWFSMIRQNDVSVIVNLCKVVEVGKVKCERYWPEMENNEEKFGETSVLLSSDKRFDEYCIRKLRLRYEDGFEKEVTQLHYIEWPDHGCPNNEVNVLQMIESFDKLHEKASEKPVVVHCSAGCGRTGTIIAANIVRELINSQKLTDELNLYDIVMKLRKQRVSMVQTPDQYQFLHKLVVHFCREKLKSLEAEFPLPNGDGLMEKNDKTASADVKSAASVVPEYPVEPTLRPLGAETPPLNWNEQNAITG